MGISENVSLEVQIIYVEDIFTRKSKTVKTLVDGRTLFSVSPHSIIRDRLLPYAGSVASLSEPMGGGLIILRCFFLDTDILLLVFT